MLLICALACSGTHAAEYHLRLHHSLPAAAPAHHQMLLPWARKVEQDSNGRLSISVHPSMQLGGQAPQLIDQARDGVVDIIWTLAGYTPGRFPRLEVFELPFLNADPAVMNLALYDFVRRHPEEFAEYRLLSAFTHFGQALHARRPVRNAEDVEGMKIRVPSRMCGWIVSAMGADPVGSPVSKIPELLSKGVIDGALIPFEVVQAVKVDELVDYHMTLDKTAFDGSLDRQLSDRFNTQIFLMAMNPQSYASLPADLRAVIDRNSGEETARWFAEIWSDNEIPGREAAARSGELISIAPQQVRRLREMIEAPVQQRWFQTVAARGLDGPALLAEAKALLAERQRQETAP